MALNIHIQHLRSAQLQDYASIPLAFALYAITITTRIHAEWETFQ